jgi:hypothetical protein
MLIVVSNMEEHRLSQFAEFFVSSIRFLNETKHQQMLMPKEESNAKNIFI